MGNLLAHAAGLFLHGGDIYGRGGSGKHQIGDQEDLHKHRVLNDYDGNFGEDFAGQ